MKQILLAWIDQILQFDNQAEANRFCDILTKKPYPSEVLWTREDRAGKVFLRIRKAYNNSPFYKEELKGGSL